EGIVNNHRVTEVVRVAKVSEVALAHESVKGKGGFLKPVRLAKDTDRSINGLNEVGWPNITVRIRRTSGAPVKSIETFEDVRRRRRRRAGLRRNRRTLLRCLTLRRDAARRNIEPWIQRRRLKLAPLARLRPGTREVPQVALELMRFDEPLFSGLAINRSVRGLIR